MIRKLSLCLASLALGIGSAASGYTIDVPYPFQVGSAHLKAGEYELQVRGKQAIFRSAKSSIPVPVRVEREATTIRYTIFETVNNRLLAIHIAGTDTKLVFPADESATEVGE